MPLIYSFRECLLQFADFFLELLTPLTTDETLTRCLFQSMDSCAHGLFSLS